MNEEVFAEWMRRQGHKVYRTESSYWYDAGPGVLQAFPYHWIIAPDDREIRDLLVKKKLLALRYSAPKDYHEGKMSYHIVMDQYYSLDTLRQKARNGVRRGLERFRIEEISFKRLATEGWSIQEDTLLRQNRSRSMTRKDWELLCTSAAGLPGIHVYGALADGELAGALIVCRIGNIYSVPYSLSHCRFLGDHVNNALFFTVSCKLLQEPGVTGIFFTVQSLDAPVHIDEFKIRMGFTLVPVRQRVAFNPLLKPFITPGVYRINRKLCERFPSSPTLAKSEGMLRFHLEGLKPLDEQAIPEFLRQYVSGVNNFLEAV